MTDYLTYYKILEIAESATEEKIKEAYRRLSHEYHPDKVPSHLTKLKKDAEEKFKQINEAYEVLVDPDKRKQYDALLMEYREKAQQFTSDESQHDTHSTTSSCPQLELSKIKFEFKNIRANTSVSDSFTISNIGGGTLSGIIKTNKRWLKTSQNSIDTNRHIQDITFFIDTSGLAFGLKDIGIIEIKSNGGTEEVYVDLSVEIPEADLARFRRRLTIGGLVLGFIFGLQIFNFFIGATFDHTFLIALILITIVGSKSGYKVAGGGGAFGWGLGIFVGGLIFLLILQMWFPHAFSAVAWALIYGSIANISSTPIRRGLWQGNYQVPIGVGIGVIVLTVMLIIVGVEGERQKRNAESARSKGMQNALQTISKRISGDWEGEVNSKRAKLTIFQNGKAYIVYSNFKEFLSLSEFDLAHEKFVLKGTSFENLGSPENFRFSLDTFHGQLSKDGRTISGNFVDTVGNKGNWSVTRHVYTETLTNTKTVTQRSVDGSEGTIKYKKYTKGGLGVTAQNITAQLQESFGLKDNLGVLVSDIEPNSPAAKAGIKSGDVMIKYNGSKIENPLHLFTLGTFTDVNDHSGVDIVVIRDGKELTLNTAILELQKAENEKVARDIEEEMQRKKYLPKPLDEHKSNGKKIEESGKVTKGETNQIKVKTTLNPNSLFASRNSRIYHKSNCLELNAEDLIEFTSLKKAQEAGGLPCEYCNSSTFIRGNIINVENSNIFAITNHVKDSNKFDIHYRTFPSTFQETWYGVIQQLNIQKEKGIQQRKDKGIIITDLTRHGIYGFPKYDKYYIVIEQMNYSTTKVSLKLFTYYREMKEKNFAEIVQNIKDNKDVSLIPQETTFANKRAKKFLDNISKILAKNY